MKELEEKIVRCGKVYEGDVLKVDGFLNHQIDVDFLCLLGREFFRLFEKENVTKILTIEASGIGLACLTAQYFHVPVVFAKKSKTNNISDDVYVSSVFSYTHKTTSSVIVSKEFLNASDRILILDDFLALGNAMVALTDIVSQSGASLAGCGVAIEKAYQPGGDMLRARGIRVESLARVRSMSASEGIQFC